MNGHHSVDALGAVTKLLSPMQGPEFESVRVKHAQEALGVIRKFIEEFEKKKIYLSEHVSRQIEELMSNLWKETHIFHVQMDMAEREEQQGKYGSKSDAWGKSWDSFANKYPAVLKSLQNEFRELLGVEKSTSN